MVLLNCFSTGSLGAIENMNEIQTCPKCSSDLGLSGGQYCCWNPNCDFQSYRPWIHPPKRGEDFDVPTDLEKVIGECLNAAANGPFFVDNGAKDNPYWEYQTLLGFTAKEVQEVSNQWPNIDITDEFICELISSCFGNLFGYPHGCQNVWKEYFSVSREGLKEFAKSWRESKYVQST